MINTSSTYQTIMSDPAHTTEVRLDINNVSYYSDSIVSMNAVRSLFQSDSPSVGGCSAAEIDAVLLIPSASIPRMATLNPYIRVRSANGLTVSEWIPQGKFFIDTRVLDPETGSLTIHGYDAMLKGEQLYLTGNNWSGSTKTVSTVVNEIATRMGVSIDSRTSLTNYYVTKPADDATMREVLGHIGASQCGNWIITLEGKLLLIRMNDIPAETSLLVDDYGNPIVFGGVRIIV